MYLGTLAWKLSAEAAIDAISALIAWDNCGKLVGYEPRQLTTVISREPENHAALLLLPAVIILHGDDTHTNITNLFKERL